MTGRSLFCALAAIPFLFSCVEQTAGGNGTSTDNVVTARRLSVDSIARDLPVVQDSGPYPLLVRLDRQLVDFSKSWPDGSDLRFQDSDSTPLPFQIREWDSTAGHASAWVRMPQLRLGKGRFLFLRLGRDSVQSRSSAAKTWAGVADSVRARVASILLADFESQPTVALLPCACDTWYVNASSGGHLNYPTQGSSFSLAVQSAADSKRGHAAHISYSAPSPQWALIGTRLGRGWHRFGGLDSITLWAKGNGTMYVALENGRDTTGYLKAWKSFQLGSDWKSYTVYPSQFDPTYTTAGGLTAGWGAVKDSVNTFTVFGQGGSDLWIDDVRFHGLSPAEVQ